MFKFQKAFFQDAKSMNLKIFTSSIVILAIIFLIGYVNQTFLEDNLMVIQFNQMTGQSISQPLIKLILILLVALLVFVFLAFQFFTGIVQISYNAVKHQTFSFKDIFAAFKKGVYLRSVLLALFVLPILIIASFLIQLIASAVHYAILFVYVSLENVILRTDHVTGLALTAQLTLQTLFSFIVSIFAFLFVILVINMITAFVKDPKQNPLRYLTAALRGFKNGQKTWFKFFIGILLLNLCLLIYNVIILLSSLLTSNVSQNFADILMIVLGVIGLILKVTVFAIIMISIVTYFAKDGKLPAKTVDKTK